MLKKLIAGECSLSKTFWGYGVLGFFIFIILTSVTQNTFLQALCAQRRTCADVNIVIFTLSHFVQLLLHGGKAAMYLVFHLIVSGCFVAYMIMVVRGLWKCAPQYEGKKFLGWLAKILLICLVCIGIRVIL